MKFEKNPSIGAGLNVMRFAAKLKLKRKQAAKEPEPEPEPEEKGIAPSLAGGMMAIRFAAKAKTRIADARAKAKADGNNKRETVSVDKQVSLVTQSLGQLDGGADIHSIVSALNAAKYLGQKHQSSAAAADGVAAAARLMEKKLRAENPELGKKMDLRSAPKVKATIRRMWDLLLVSMRSILFGMKSVICGPFWTEFGVF